MNYILFSSNHKLTIFSKRITWNGTLEYSYNNKFWKVWNGKKISNKCIFLRGTNNTIISDGDSWDLIGTNIHCQGNIENLLDYKSVQLGFHPKMDRFCFTNLFHNNKSLVTAPNLPSTALSPYCYYGMFWNCTSLIGFSELPATILPERCYDSMFYGCSSLIMTPSFPNITIAKEIIINNGTTFHLCDKLKYIKINNKMYNINIFKLL